MILFVFEGKKREPMLFKALQKLFFREEQHILCSYGNNIYQLYKDLKMDEEDSLNLVSLLMEREKDSEESTFSAVNSTDDISEIYLFFDYDFQNKNLASDEIDQMLTDMLEYFSDETGNGKLYINYPMIESIRYFKSLDDNQYDSYTVSRTECLGDNFKCLADEFSCFKSLDFLTLTTRREPSDNEINSRRENWTAIKQMNVRKANYICKGESKMPIKKSDIDQQTVFENQLRKYVMPLDQVAVLNAFPLFLFDYFRV